MISFGTPKHLKRNLFASWYKWIDDALHNGVFKRYQILQLNDKRNDKTSVYFS